MQPNLTGGCVCGAVRYRANAPPRHSVICQCRQCQRATGTGHAPQFAVPAESVHIEGEVRFYCVTADSGHAVHNGFCPTCGNPVLRQSDGYREVIFFYAATLDAPMLFEPEAVVYHASGQPWDGVDPDLPRL